MLPQLDPRRTTYYDDGTSRAARGLAIGVVVAIAVACLVGICSCIFIVFCFIRSRRRRRQRNNVIQLNNAGGVPAGPGPHPYYQQGIVNNPQASASAYPIMSPPPPAAHQPYDPAPHVVPLSPPAGEGMASSKFSPTPASQPTYGHYA